MPVRSLNSPVLRWPERKTVLEAFEKWAQQRSDTNPNIVRIGYFGSFADGTDGFGSDLDVIILMAESREPFFSRSARFDTTHLPVPADLLVYTESEWESMVESGNRITRGVKWLRLTGAGE